MNEALERLLNADGGAAINNRRIEVHLPLPDDVQVGNRYRVQASAERSERPDFDSWMSLAVERAFAKLELAIAQARVKALKAASK